MKQAIFAIAIAVTLVAALGLTATFADNGHTPTVVCHWVPAHGGSFITIVIDDDGANGNAALRAHFHHQNDIISPASGECPSTPTSTPMNTPTLTPVNTPTLTPENTPTLPATPTGHKYAGEHTY